MIALPTLAAVKAASIKIAIGLALGAGIALAGYLHGLKVAAGEKAEAERNIAIAYAERIVELTKQSEQLTAENNTLRARQATTNRTVTREVLRYVEVTPPDHRVVLPGTFRLRHDIAALGHVPEGARTGPLADGSAGTPQTAPVADAIVLETLDNNYRACREIAARLEGWQRRQRALKRSPESDQP